MLRRPPLALVLLSVLMTLSSSIASAGPVSPLTAGGALAGERPRVIVSTDIGGTDPDDFQSLVHLLLYADVLDLEGVISSPWGAGRKTHILEVIEKYAVDFPNLHTHSARYPAPETLRALTKQGAIDSAPPRGFSEPTEGSRHIIDCACRDDARPLWILIWGGIDDLAQALHDAPEIAPKLRVYAICGPNKKWSISAYTYLEQHHPALWFIENNSTYRGWFVGGDQTGDLGNTSFVTQHIRGNGALGGYFAQHLGGTIKMGDTPSVTYLLRGTPEDPAVDSWGGRFVRAWPRPRLTLARHATAGDRLEQFGILELILPAPAATSDSSQTDTSSTSPATATLRIDNQDFPGFRDVHGAFHFRFMPKETKTWRYEIISSLPSLDGQRGAFTSYAHSPAADLTHPIDPRHPQWWTDDPAPTLSEGPHQGARTLNQHRAAFLRDFAARMSRCQTPAPPEVPAVIP